MLVCQVLREMNCDGLLINAASQLNVMRTFTINEICHMGYFFENAAMVTMSRILVNEGRGLE